MLEIILMAAIILPQVKHYKSEISKNADLVISIEQDL